MPFSTEEILEELAQCGFFGTLGGKVESPGLRIHRGDMAGHNWRPEDRKTHRQRHPDRYREYKRAYYRRHRERLKAQMLTRYHAGKART